MTGMNPASRRPPKIGDVYYVRLSGVGSEQSGCRPCLIFQNNKGNIHSPNLIVLPLTSSVKRLDIPTHVLLRSSDTGLPKDSVVLCENPECISKERLGRYVTSLSPPYMRKIAKAYLIATSAISYLDPAMLSQIWQEAVRLNAA